MDFDPVRAGVAALVAGAGLWSVWWGRQHKRTPIVLGGLILAGAPIVISDVSHLLGFAAGVGGSMLLLGKRLS